MTFDPECEHCGDECYTMKEVRKGKAVWRANHNPYSKGMIVLKAFVLHDGRCICCDCMDEITKDGVLQPLSKHG